MRFKEYLTEGLKFEIGDYILQKGSDYESFGKIISQLKNGSFKAKVFTSYSGSVSGKAVQKSLKGWYPDPVKIDSKNIPPKILNKLN